MYLKNSQPRRDLPTPAMPTTETSCALPSSAQAWKSSFTKRSSRSRPTNGGSSPADLRAPPTPAVTRSARQSGTGSDLPLSSNSPAPWKAIAASEERRRRLADEHLSGLGRGLDARRGVDEISGDHALALGAECHSRLACQNSRARTNARSEFGDGGNEVESCSDRAFSVVLLHDGGTPHRHHCVTDELFDDPAVALDHGLARVEITGEELASLLRVSSFGSAREADQVGEEDGDKTALGGGGLARGAARRGGCVSRSVDRGSALATKANTWVVDPSAAGAGQGEGAAAPATELAPSAVFGTADRTDRHAWQSVRALGCPRAWRTVGRP